MIRFALLFHLVALTVLACGGLGGGLLHIRLRNALRTAPAQAGALGPLAMNFGIVAQIGALLMLLSGIALLASRGWADWGQHWLSTKLTIFVIMVANGVLVAKPAGARLASAAARAATGEDTRADVAAAVQRLGTFHLVQLVGFLAIIALGVLGPR